MFQDSKRSLHAISTTSDNVMSTSISPNQSLMNLSDITVASQLEESYNSISQLEKSSIDDLDPQALWNLVIKFKRDWRRIHFHFEKTYNMKIDKNTLKEKLKVIGSAGRFGHRFSKNEDVRLINFVRKEGHDWLKCSQYFPGRCPLSLRNRYYGLQKKTKNFKIKIRGDVVRLDVPISEIELDFKPEFLTVIENLLKNCDANKNT